VLNPAEPPLMMRDTVFCLVDADADQEAIRLSDAGHGAQRGGLCSRLPAQAGGPVRPDPGGGAGQRARHRPRAGLKVSVFLEVEGAAHYLPAYAGNLDIMTSAALATADKIAASLIAAVVRSIHVHHGRRKSTSRT
jgi:acetaldehyde dehydrogenase